MKFSELANNLTDAKVITDADAEITGITYDSRKVEPGFVFVAMAGGSFDGHDYIADAVKSGARAIVSERPAPPAIKSSIPQVIAPNGRVAMGEIAAPFYGYPSRQMKLIGVTGTSGKTTVTHLIHSVFSSYGAKAGLIGTLGACIGDESMPTQHTTPESADLQRVLRLMVDSGVKACAMEVSSHGLYQGRVLGCEFDCGVFMNIARDHLDFHETTDAYLDAKLMLFRDYPKKSTKRFRAVVNADDPAAARVIEACGGSAMTFAVENPSQVKALNVAVSERSVQFELAYRAQRARVLLGIGGEFNVYNALAAAAVAFTFGVDIDSIAYGLRKAPAVPGRFESVDCGQDFGVIVDYAHTPDEIENVLKTARQLTSGRLIVVFGCGGNRDTGKRPIMGRLGVELADLAVITSDNPRSEDPEAIIADIVAGIPDADRSRVHIEIDRREAIEKAAGLAGRGDLVIIAGKGHEDYQIFADRTIHFDDREVAREVLMSKAEGTQSRKPER